jgi:hypothetical protein
MGFIPWLALENKSCATGTVEGHKLSSSSRFLHAFSMGCRWASPFLGIKSLGFGSDLPLGEGETIG